MMKWKGIFLMWLGVGLLVSPSVWAERHDSGPPHPEEGRQKQHAEKDQDQESLDDRGSRDSDVFRRGPRQAGFMGSSERDSGRSRGFGSSSDRGGNGGPGERDGFRGRFGRVGTAELMAFLKEHEKELAETCK